MERVVIMPDSPYHQDGSETRNARWCEFVLFDVFYVDGSQRSNRRVPSKVLGTEGDAPASAFIAEQDRAIAKEVRAPRGGYKECASTFFNYGEEDTGEVLATMPSTEATPVIGLTTRVGCHSLGNRCRRARTLGIESRKPVGHARMRGLSQSWCRI
jgi:hypothetical protein